MIPVALYLGIILLLLVVGGMVFFVLRRMESQAYASHNRSEKFRERQRRAVWAGATIVSIRQVSVAEDARGREKIDLTLQVQPPKGESYSAHAAWYADLSAISQLVAGASVSVKIDATDPKIIYPNMTGVEYWVWS